MRKVCFQTNFPAWKTTHHWAEGKPKDCVLELCLTAWSCVVDTILEHKVYIKSQGKIQQHRASVIHTKWRYWFNMFPMRRIIEKAKQHYAYLHDSTNTRCWLKHKDQALSQTRSLMIQSSLKQLTKTPKQNATVHNDIPQTLCIQRKQEKSKSMPTRFYGHRSGA